MNLEALAAYLQTSSLGTVGQSIFVHKMPEGIEGVLLLGKLSGTPIDHELPKYRRTGFQAIVRKKDYSQGKTLANQVSSALTLDEKVLTGMSIRYVHPKHEPVAYPVSSGDYLEFSVNFDAVYVITS